MFGIMKTVSEVTSKEIKTIIDKDTHIVGNINGDGSLRVDGTVDGDITLDGCVFIGESGRVNGTITADELTISGVVDGNVIISNRLSIYADGQLTGDISAGSLSVEVGGHFNGYCNMSPAFA